MPEVRDHVQDILNAFRERCPDQVPDPVKISRIPNVISHDIRIFLEEKGYLKPESTPEEQSEEMEETLQSLGYF